MNPNSMFSGEFRDRKRNGNVAARLLDVKEDVEPVIQYLKDHGASDTVLRDLIMSHPPTLCYDVDTRIRPFFDYMRCVTAPNAPFSWRSPGRPFHSDALGRELGVEDPVQVLARRPSLLGLDVDNNLKAGRGPALTGIEQC